MSRKIGFTLGKFADAEKRVGALLYHNNRLMVAYDAFDTKWPKFGVLIADTSNIDGMIPRPDKEGYQLNAQHHELAGCIRRAVKKGFANGASLVNNPLTHSWALCEEKSCGKWRTVPEALRIDLDKPSARFVCSMNRAPHINSCDPPEESWDSLRKNIATVSIIGVVDDPQLSAKPADVSIESACLLEQEPMDADDLKFEHIVARTGNAEVHKAFCKSLKETVAVKQFDVGTPQEQLSVLRKVKKERDLQRMVNGYSLVRVIGWMQLPTLAIVMEWVPGGTLFDAVFTQTPLKNSDKESIARDVAKALVMLHQQGIAHLDIKPQNVLLTLACPELQETPPPTPNPVNRSEEERLHTAHLSNHRCTARQSLNPSLQNRCN